METASVGAAAPRGLSARGPPPGRRAGAAAGNSSCTTAGPPRASRLLGPRGPAGCPARGPSLGQQGDGLSPSQFQSVPVSPVPVSPVPVSPSQSQPVPASPSQSQSVPVSSSQFQSVPVSLSPTDNLRSSPFPCLGPAPRRKKSRRPPESVGPQTEPPGGGWGEPMRGPCGSSERTGTSGSSCIVR